ncbi:hypothetical protein B0H13DRAFT_2327370 [Mycena leptocephala]|nr:hypothetical protein B0H13DRAFT_2327370 [Mycena leptocephala]
MALFLTPFTHLCVHLFGLMGNPVLTLVFSAIVILAYWLYLVLLPAVWPGRILHDTLTCIDAMKTRLHEEAPHAQGLRRPSIVAIAGLITSSHATSIFAQSHRCCAMGVLGCISTRHLPPLASAVYAAGVLHRPCLPRHTLVQ